MPSTVSLHPVETIFHASSGCDTKMASTSRESIRRSCRRYFGIGRRHESVSAGIARARYANTSRINLRARFTNTSEAHEELGRALRTQIRRESADAVHVHLPAGRQADRGPR